MEFLVGLHGADQWHISEAVIHLRVWANKLPDEIIVLFCHLALRIGAEVFGDLINIYVNRFEGRLDIFRIFR